LILYSFNPLFDWKIEGSLGSKEPMVKNVAADKASHNFNNLYIERCKLLKALGFIIDSTGELSLTSRRVLVYWLRAALEAL
jgi:hypothetical protein